MSHTSTLTWEYFLEMLGNPFQKFEDAIMIVIQEGENKPDEAAMPIGKERLVTIIEKDSPVPAKGVHVIMAKTGMNPFIVTNGRISECMANDILSRLEKIQQVGTFRFGGIWNDWLICYKYNHELFLPVSDLSFGSTILLDHLDDPVVLGVSNDTAIVRRF